MIKELNQINKTRDNNAETKARITELELEPVSETQGLAVVADPVYPVLQVQVAAAAVIALALVSLQVQTVISVVEPAVELDSAGQPVQARAAPAADDL